jgi:hypothetical protein
MVAEIFFSCKILNTLQSHINKNSMVLLKEKANNEIVQSTRVRAHLSLVDNSQSSKSKYGWQI